jgi:hypothetical protein
MRQIISPPFDSIHSPARHIMRFLHRTMVNIAPENGRVFDEEFRDFILEYIDTHQWV